MASPYVAAVARLQLLLLAGDIIERMTRRATSLTVAALLLVALVTVACVAPRPYGVRAPGRTENTLGTQGGKPVVTIAGHRTYPTSGHLDLTTVSVTSPDYSPRLPEILQAWWSSSELVLPRDAVYAPQQSVQQVEQTNKNQMLSSQKYAVIAGLAAAGFDALDVTVVSVTKGSPAAGVLRKGDVVTAIGGQPVASTQQVVDAASSHQPGDSVSIGFQRGGKPHSVTVKTQPSPDDPKTARVGLVLRDAYHPPFGVNIRLGQDIGGPSAGLMFSLAVYDVLTPGQLTGGRFIAGTGTIDPAGEVGVIGGIQQKIAGAYRSGATVFLVPSGDCAEAVGSDVADKIQLVRVSTISDAISALHQIDAGRNAAVPGCGQ